MTVKPIPEGVQAMFPMLVCQSPEAEMNFCAAAFGAVERVHGHRARMARQFT